MHYVAHRHRRNKENACPEGAEPSARECLTTLPERMPAFKAFMLIKFRSSY